VLLLADQHLQASKVQGDSPSKAIQPSHDIEPGHSFERLNTSFQRASVFTYRYTSIHCVIFKRRKFNTKLPPFPTIILAPEKLRFGRKMRSTTSILLLSLLAPAAVLGDAQFTSPVAAGTSSFVGGTQFTVSWADNAANVPSIASAVGDWTLFLCTGGDTAATMVRHFADMSCSRTYLSLRDLIWSCRTARCQVR